MGEIIRIRCERLLVDKTHRSASILLIDHLRFSEPFDTYSIMGESFFLLFSSKFLRKIKFTSKSFRASTFPRIRGTFELILRLPLVLFPLSFFLEHTPIQIRTHRAQEQQIKFTNFLVRSPFFFDPFLRNSEESKIYQAGN